MFFLRLTFDFPEENKIKQKNPKGYAFIDFRFEDLLLVIWRNREEETGPRNMLLPRER